MGRRLHGFLAIEAIATMAQRQWVSFDTIRYTLLQCVFYDAGQRLHVNEKN